MGSYLRVLPAFLTLLSFSVTLFTLGLRLFFILLQKNKTVPKNEGKNSSKQKSEPSCDHNQQQET